MIIFTILLVALLAAAIVSVVSAIIAGTGFLVVFGDLITFGLIIWVIVKLFRRKK